MSDYNGWTNKETWLVNVWLGDYLAKCAEEGQLVTEDFIREMVDEYFGHRFGDDSDESGLLADMLNCALGEINYSELAQYYQPEEREE